MTIVIFIYILSFFQSFQDQDKMGNLTVEVEGIEDLKGAVAVALYSSEEGFLKTDFRNIHFPIEGKKIIIEIKDIPSGRYAISLFHDLNENKKLDKNFIGLPTEAYGFGNNARGTFGPPSFEEASVTIEDEKTITVTITLN